ncbi:MAG: hypothetical protein ACRD3S_17455, partial [Terracidiphilus sp.]
MIGKVQNTAFPYKPKRKISSRRVYKVGGCLLGSASPRPSPWRTGNHLAYPPPVVAHFRFRASEAGEYVRFWEICLKRFSPVLFAAATVHFRKIWFGA